MLKDLSSVSQRIVNEFLAEQELDLLVLNKEWDLDNQHNKRRGMKHHDIFKDFDLTRPTELL